jgi:DNA-binding NarL/FixJ family response regulator
VAEVATIHQLHPVRVLVAGDDPLFVSRVAAELITLGFNVMSTTAPGRAAELAALQRVNVVLLDVSGGLATAVSTASALDALPHRVQVVLFGRHGRAATKLGYELVDPGASGAELAAVVQRAYRGGPSRVGRVGRS